jgi:hypothetical protein
VRDQTRCEALARALGNPPKQARELCADRLMQRCTRGLLLASPSQSEALDDVLACYGRDPEKEAQHV